MPPKENFIAYKHTGWSGGLQFQYYWMLSYAKLPRGMSAQAEVPQLTASKDPTIKAAQSRIKQMCNSARACKNNNQKTWEKDQLCNMQIMHMQWPHMCDNSDACTMSVLYSKCKQMHFHAPLKQILWPW